jgi:thiol-disulfide isomerase/thioredoxin
MLRAIIIGVVAFIVVTGVLVYRIATAGGPPITGAMANFKLAPKPTPVPAVEIIDEQGRKIQLTDLKGKMTLVNIWATWCAPCVEELPSLQRLKQAKQTDHFDVVTISEDHGGKVAVDSFFLQHGLQSLPRDLDPDANLSRFLAVGGLPTTLLIDQHGYEIGRYEGETDWSGPDAAKLIDYYLARQADADAAKQEPVKQG